MKRKGKRESFEDFVSNCLNLIEKKRERKREVCFFSWRKVIEKVVKVKEIGQSGIFHNFVAPSMIETLLENLDTNHDRAKVNIYIENKLTIYLQKDWSFDNWNFIVEFWTNNNRVRVNIIVYHNIKNKLTVLIINYLQKIDLSMIKTLLQNLGWITIKQGE